jgi:diguanylate cyclase (GGDEF)-like protein/PAS domain S-box-containing protein
MDVCLLTPPPPQPAPAAEVRASLTRALAASDGLGVAVCDREFRYLLWNRFMEELTGLPARAVLGRGALEIHPHLREERLEAVLHRVLAGETVSLPDRRFIVPGVRSGWIWAQYHPHRLPGGEVAGVIGLVHDVTERVRAEEENQRLAAFLRAAPGPALECDPAGRVVFVNPAAERMTGELGLPRPAALLPGGHADLVRGALATGGRVLRVEVELGGRTLSWAYHGQPPLGLVHCLAEDVSARRRAEARLRRDALHDALTGLPNRRHFEDGLSAAVERSRRGGGPGPAVCLLDLDRLEVVNDSLGHGVGDALIVGVAGRLAAALPPGALAARWEGDEFAVLLEGSGEAEAMEHARRLQEAVAAPLTAGEHELRVSATAGVAVWGPHLGSPAGVLWAADTALHRAKAAGPGHRARFDEAMHRAALGRLRTETELRGAIGRGEITAFYQPIVSLESGRIVGAEALARWRHPVRGWLSPLHFVSAAEESDLILDLGRAVLEEACAAAARWPAGVALGVNLSVRQLTQHDLGSTVRAALEQAPLDARRLRLEVTESLLARDPGAAGVALDTLRQLGIGVWMDDFGTGYSSLATLHRHPPDGIKIDRAFVAGVDADPRARAVVEALVRLAGALEVAVVAEGVERPGQFAALRALGCATGQGFLFSPPVEGAAFERLLAGRPRW